MEVGHRLEGELSAYQPDQNDGRRAPLRSGQPPHRPGQGRAGSGRGAADGDRRHIAASSRSIVCARVLTADCQGRGREARRSTC